MHSEDRTEHLLQIIKQLRSDGGYVVVEDVGTLRVSVKRERPKPIFRVITGSND